MHKSSLAAALVGAALFAGSLCSSPSRAQSVHESRSNVQGDEVARVEDSLEAALGGPIRHEYDTAEYVDFKAGALRFFGNAVDILRDRTEAAASTADDNVYVLSDTLDANGRYVASGFDSPIKPVSGQMTKDQVYLDKEHVASHDSSVAAAETVFHELVHDRSYELPDWERFSLRRCFSEESGGDYVGEEWSSVSSAEAWRHGRPWSYGASYVAEDVAVTAAKLVFSDAAHLRDDVAPARDSITSSGWWRGVERMEAKVDCLLEYDVIRGDERRSAQMAVDSLQSLGPSHDSEVSPVKRQCHGSCISPDSLSSGYDSVKP